MTDGILRPESLHAQGGHGDTGTGVFPKEQKGGVMNQLYCGVDIAKETAVFCLVAADGRPVEGATNVKRWPTYKDLYTGQWLHPNVRVRMGENSESNG